MGVAKRILPPHMVAIQLKILMPVGTPTNIVDNVKNALDTDVMPTVNIWCAQTLTLTKAMQTDALTMARYPKIAFRENTGIISLAIPKAGMTRTYTSGWPKIQK